jgi:hypothetical protein
MQAWYQGGISVMDFTDPANPIEIAYFDRGPIDANVLAMGGHWSAYWYNGHVFASEAPWLGNLAKPLEKSPHLRPPSSPCLDGVA